MAPEADITFKRVAVTAKQISDWSLPSRPTKSTESRSRKFGSEIFVELDAIEPELLRGLVRQAIEQHLPADQFNVLKVAEQSERELIRQLVGTIAVGVQ
jgi:hypothetical protein